MASYVSDFNESSVSIDQLVAQDITADTAEINLLTASSGSISSLTCSSITTDQIIGATGIFTDIDVSNNSTLNYITGQSLNISTLQPFLDLGCITTSGYNLYDPSQGQSTGESIRHFTNKVSTSPFFEQVKEQIFLDADVDSKTANSEGLIIGHQRNSTPVIRSYLSCKNTLNETKDLRLQPNLLNENLGNVSIGLPITSSASSKLHVNGNITTLGIDSNAGNFNSFFCTNGTASSMSCGVVFGTTGIINHLSATSAVSNTVTCNALSATTGNISTLSCGVSFSSPSANITSLSCNNANITDLTIGTSISTPSLSVGNLTATNGNINSLTCSSINNSTIDVINTPSISQILNIGTQSTQSKTVNIGSQTTDVTAGKAPLVIGRNGMLEFGGGVSGKEINAGKIGYQTFDNTALNIVGAGTGTNRLTRFYDAVGIGASASTAASLTTGGPITINGARLNLFNTDYSVRAESSSLTFYVNAGTTPMLTLNNNAVISTGIPIRTTSNIGLINGSNASVITTSSQSSQRLVNIPTVASNADFVLTQADQSITGTKTFTDNVSTGQINLFNSNYSVRADNSGGQVIIRSNGSDMCVFDQVANRINANLVPIRTVSLRLRSNPVSFDTIVTNSAQTAEQTVFFPTLDGFNNEIAMIEDYSYTVEQWNGPWSSAQNGTLRAYRIGKQVTLFFPTVNFTATTASVVNWSGTLLARHRPSSTCYYPAAISNNLGGFSITGRVLVNNSGSIVIGSTNLGAAFSGTGSNGFVSFSVTYVTA